MIHEADKTLKELWLSRFTRLPVFARQELKGALKDLQADAAQRADYSWKKHKAPMALYWKVVGVYAGHLARAIRVNNLPKELHRDAERRDVMPVVERNTLTIAKRLTHQYATGHEHLDRWQTLGELTAYTLSREEDEDGTIYYTLYGSFERAYDLSDRPVKATIAELEAAICDSLTGGCTCEHDCCGCRFWGVSEIEHLKRGHWHIVVKSSINC